MGKSAPKKRVVFRIDADPQTASKFIAICDETGMSQIVITSRLVNWFASQDSEIQARILGVFGAEGKSEAAKLFLQKLANSAEKH